MGVEAISNSVGNVRSAIAQASQATGIDFDYLLGQAQLESGLNPSARAGTSSAAGLYQFIDQSWLSVVKQHGSNYGLGWAANAISRGANGRLNVADPAMRRAILDLRNNPAVSASMAAASASDNKSALEGSLGRGATGTDLYMAHFLGLGGAKSFLRTMQGNPGVSGAAMFPAAARANRGIFYDASGNARSLGDIYQRFAAKLDKGAASVGATGPASDALGTNPALIPAIARGGDFETARANFAVLAGITNIGDATVIAGSGETNQSAAVWAKAALARVNSTTTADGASANPATDSTNLLRPTPDTARLAYMMLASLGSRT